MALQPFIRKLLPYIGIVAVYALGANLDIMEVDAAQYASISLEMLKSGNWLEVIDRNEPYLDKPPLLFWLSALSFKFLGIGNWQYKLPSILFSLLGIFSTYKLGKRLYTEQIGHYAAMIFSSTLAMVMINNDVKTDTILVSSIIFSIWMLVAAMETNKWKYYLLAPIGIGAAMLTKGPIGLMMPLLAIVGHSLLHRNWKWLLNARWLVVIILLCVTLLPMCIGLYRQYGPDGLKFYFWTQSFGRITGENEWRNDTTILYFFHVFAWSFLPWSLLGIIAMIKELRSIPTRLKTKTGELYLISGIALVWVALSMSKFKLPHYIFVVYPLIAILIAKYLSALRNTNSWAWTQLILSTASSLILFLGLLMAFPNGNWVGSIIASAAILIAVIIFAKTEGAARIIWPTFIIAVTIGLGLNLHFYPSLLAYQANANAGKWIHENGIEEDEFIAFSTGGHSLDFYTQRNVPWMEDVSSTIDAIRSGTVVYAKESLRNDLIKRGYPPKKEMVLENFEVQKLTLEFLNPKTREQAIKKNYLMFY